MRFLNWRLRPKQSLTPKRGSILLMSVEPFDKSFVGWPVITHILGPFIKDNNTTVAADHDEAGTDAAKAAGSGVSCGRIITRAPLTITLIAIVVTGLLYLDPTLGKLIPGGPLKLSLDALPSLMAAMPYLIGIVLLLALLIGLAALVWVTRLILTYWRYEWSRRHIKYLFFLDGLWHFEARFIARAVSPFFSGDNPPVVTFTRMDQMLELEMVSDVEDLPGGEKTSDAQDAWNQYLSKKYGVRTIRVPSMSESPDILRYVADAPSTLDSLNQIIDLGRTYLQDFSSFQQAEVRAKSADAGSKKFDARARAREVEKVREDFSRLYPQSIDFYPDVFAVGPGAFDRKSVQEVEDLPGTAHQSQPEPVPVPNRSEIIDFELYKSGELSVLSHEAAFDPLQRREDEPPAPMPKTAEDSDEEPSEHPTELWDSIPSDRD
jgi:hypothetical protein